MPPGMILIGRAAGGRGRGRGAADFTHVVGTQAKLTTSLVYAPPMNGVLPDAGYEVRVQLARESPATGPTGCSM